MIVSVMRPTPISQLVSRGLRNAPVKKMRQECTIIDAATIVVGYVVILVVTLIVGAVSHTLASLVALLLYLVVLAWAIYNFWIKQGQTGYTLGKGVIGIKLVDATTGAPVGVGLAIARNFVHILDSIPCYIGWLWPLWDARRETFADKILKQAVVEAAKVDPKSFLPEQLNRS